MLYPGYRHCLLCITNLVLLIIVLCVRVLLLCVVCGVPSLSSEYTLPGTIQALLLVLFCVVVLWRTTYVRTDLLTRYSYEYVRTSCTLVLLCCIVRVVPPWPCSRYLPTDVYIWYQQVPGVLHIHDVYWSGKEDIQSPLYLVHFIIHFIIGFSSFGRGVHIVQSISLPSLPPSAIMLFVTRSAAVFGWRLSTDPPRERESYHESAYTEQHNYWSKSSVE